MWTLLKRKLTEPSTIRALIGLAGIFGYNLAPELAEPIATAVAAAIAIVEIVRKEKEHARPETQPDKGTAAADSGLSEQAGNNP